MIKSKKQMFIVIGVFVVLLMLTTVTYAFFNYTRTGVANRISVGRIYFDSEQGNAINLTNVFPIASSEIENDSDNVASITIHITGDTTYSEGIEYLVSAVDINNTVNDKIIPINIDTTVSSTVGKTIGTSDSDYYTNRGGNNPIYKVLSDRVYLDDNSKIVVGYIPSGETGIDGTITVKAYIDKDKIAITDTYPSKTKRIVNPNMTEDEVDACVNYFVSQQYFSSTDDIEGFCRGTATISRYTFQEWIDLNRLDSFIPDLVELNVIKELYTDETTNDWVNGRMILTTEEWNNLHDTGLSFKVKVEANEGIWADEPGNAMRSMPSFYPVNSSIKAIYFEKMSPDEMEQRYESAVYKQDITYNGEGKVLSWLENDTENNSKYIMYVASDGVTMLTKGDFLFDSQEYTEIIEFHNVNTSRVTDMNHMFNYLYDLKEVDVSSFDKSNVTKMNYFINKCYDLEKVNMSGLDLRKVTTMVHMVSGNSSLTDLDMSGIQMRDVTDMGEIFYNDSSLVTLDLSGWGGDNLESVSGMFILCNALKVVNMSGFNFGKVNSLSNIFGNYLYDIEEIDLSNIKIPNVTSMVNMFASCSKLAKLNLDNIDTSNVTNINYMFYGCHSLVTLDLSSFNTSNISAVSGNYGAANIFYDCPMLTTIYVSNTWDISNQPDGMQIFYNNGSLVGGNGTHYDSTKVDKNMAVVDNNDHEGYLTLKTN